MCFIYCISEWVLYIEILVKTSSYGNASRVTYFWPIFKGIHQWPIDSHHKGPKRSIDGFFVVILTLKRKCCHFDDILITGCTGSCHFDNFQCSQWWKFHQNEDIFVSVNSNEFMKKSLLGVWLIHKAKCATLCAESTNLLNFQIQW